jgi:sugar/nucleoside kinase (ribokinase family)
MKLLVIGHSVVDTIITGQDKVIKPGGIYYSILGLVNFAEEADEIFLCSEMSNDDEYLFSDIYNKIRVDYVSYKNKIPHVVLNLYDDKERDETYCSMSTNLSMPEEDLNNFDGILLNMISGFDINLEQLRNIRNGYKGIIYIDVHTMARDLGKDMIREFRTIPDFKKWAVNIDVLQCNEEEFKTLSNKTSRIDAVRELFSYGIEIIIITKGDEGARVFFENQKRVESVYVLALKVKSTNHVGCGDVFGAVFFYNYIRNKDIAEALKFANAAAGIFTTYSQTEEYKNLKKDVLQRFS